MSIPHPEWRQRAIPDNAEVVSLNPPVFFWPLENRSELFEVEYSLHNGRALRKVKNVKGGLYTPPDVLAAGHWQWRCKAASTEHWPSWKTFVVPGNIPDYAAVPPPYFLQKCRHLSRPRILLMGLETEVLRNNLNDHPEALAIIQEAGQRKDCPMPSDDELERSLPQGESWQHSILVERTVKPHLNRMQVSIKLLLQAFLLTEDHIYLDEARSLCVQILALNPNGISAKNDFADSSALLTLALLYDTGADHLSNQEQALILKHIRIRGNRIFRMYQGIVECRVMENHAWQHILRRLALAGLAILNDGPEGEEWLDYVYQVWRGRFPILGGKDGGWANGNGYFHVNFESIAYLSLFFSLLSNVNWGNHPWFQNAGRFLALTMPSASSSDRFGDKSECDTQPSLIRIAFADALSRFTADDETHQYSIECLEHSGYKLEDEKVLRWFRILMHLAKTQRSIFPETPLLHSKIHNADRSSPDGIFPETGMAVFHSDVSTEKNIMISFRSSPYGSFGHAHADQNAFNINFGGKPLFVSAGYYTGFADPHTLKVYRHTWGQNSILIDGIGQKIGTEGFGRLYAYGRQDECSWISGDASAAYGVIESEFWIKRMIKAGIQPEATDGYGPSGLLRFHRTLLFVRPALLCIYDDLEADHDAIWQWCLHSPQFIGKADGDNCFYNENQDALISIKGTVPLKDHISDIFPIEPHDWKNQGNAYPKQWHLRIENTNKRHKMRFFTTIDLNPNPVVQDKICDGSTKVIYGNWIINAQIGTDRTMGLVIKNQHTQEEIAICEANT